MAKAKVPNMDNIAEIVLPHLLKLCASTKKIAADKANESITVIILNGSYNIYLMKLIWSACDDKNVQPRKFATGWLKTLVGKYREHKHVFEKGDALSLFEKCLKKGLADGNPDVRVSMRPAFFAFERLWPERSAGILSALSDQHRKALVNESAQTASVPAPVKAATAAVVKPVAKPKQSIKDAIAAKRQAVKIEETKKCERRISTSSSDSTESSRARAVSLNATTAAKIPRPSRAMVNVIPSSSNSRAAPVAPTNRSSSNPRPAPPTATTRTLSSAPVRPTRLMKKPTATEVKRPVTPGPIATMAAGAFSPKREVVSPILTLLRDRSKSPVPVSPVLMEMTTTSEPSIKQEAVSSKYSTLHGDRSTSPVTRGSMSTTAVTGFSPKRELASPPLINILRERSRSPASSVKSTSKASEVLSATSFDRPIMPVLSRKEGLARKALEELPVNEPINRPESIKPTHGEAVSQEKWMKVERQQLTLSNPWAKGEPHLRPTSVEGLRHKMVIRVNELRCGNYRLSTFRHIQTVIQGSWPVLGNDPQLFDELLFAIFNIIESWSMADPSAVYACGSDLYTQVLITLRVMFRHYNLLFSTYYPRALCALLSAAKSQDDNTHMRFGLEDTVKAVVAECDIGNLEDSIDSVLDYIESYTDRHYRQPEYLALLALTELMQRSDPERLCKPEDQATRLGRLAARAIRSQYPEMRSRAVEFAVAYASFLADDKWFWQSVSEVSTDSARLLTYYFTKEQVMHSFRVDDELIDHTYGAEPFPLVCYPRYRLPFHRPH